MSLRSRWAPVTVAAALLVTGSSAAVAAHDPVITAGAPTDYTKVKGLSQPTYTDIEKVTHRVPMHDGVLLHVEVTKPKGATERLPVILEASPYHGTIADREGTRIFPDPKDAAGKMIGMTGYYAPRGYAVVMVDLRGTGRSQGCLDHMGQNDAKDLKRIVEWAASQEWSNGKVGMTGHSYVGSTPMIAAAQRPKGLATIVPSAGIARAYDHQFQHGVAFTGQWGGLPAVYNVLALDRHLPKGKNPATGDTGDNFGNDMQYFGCGLTTSSAQDNEAQVSGRYTSFHAQRDHSAGAKDSPIPVFLVQGVNDVAVRASALHWFNDRHNPADKLWLGQWDHGSASGPFAGHPNRRDDQWVNALTAWFDKHLKGKDVDTGPQVEAFVNNESTVTEGIKAHDEVFTARQWPASRNKLELFPAANGSLGDSQPAAGATQTYTASPQSVNGVTTALVYKTEPVESDLLMVGVPELELVASITGQRTYLIATLLAEQEDGKQRRITQFAMQPELRHSIAAPTPVVPGQLMTLRPPGWAMAHELEKGERLVLRIASSDADKMPFWSVDPQVTVKTGPDGTVLRVPAINGKTYADPLAP